MHQSKQISKRNHAKKKMASAALKKYKKKMFVPEEVFEQHHPGFSQLSEKQKKLIRQKIKNRISAQESRDQKKLYLSNLEQQVSLLSSENQEVQKHLLQLIKENTHLKQIL